MACCCFLKPHCCYFLQISAPFLCLKPSIASVLSQCLYEVVIRTSFWTFTLFSEWSPCGLSICELKSPFPDILLLALTSLLGSTEVDWEKNRNRHKWHSACAIVPIQTHSALWCHLKDWRIPFSLRVLTDLGRTKLLSSVQKRTQGLSSYEV